MFSNPAWLSVPFLLAGGIKIVYDLLLYQMFAATRAVQHERNVSGK
jgi:hypothetical protein